MHTPFPESASLTQRCRGHEPSTSFSPVCEQARAAWQESMKLRQTYSRRPQHHWLIFLGHALDGGAFPACPAGACLLRGTLDERSALLQKMACSDGRPREKATQAMGHRSQFRGELGKLRSAD